MALSNRAESTPSANSRRAVSTLTGEVLVIGPRTRARRSAVSNVPRSVSAIGRSAPTPSINRRMVSGTG
jgi:hypothetical protein